MRRDRYDEIKKMAEVLKVRSATESQALLDLLAEVPVPPVSMPEPDVVIGNDKFRIINGGVGQIKNHKTGNWDVMYQEPGVFAFVKAEISRLRADLALMEDALKGCVVVDGVEWVRLPSNQWKAMVHDLYVQISPTGEWSEAYSSDFYPTLFAAMRAAKAGE